jgi:hypothetical protein
MPEHASRFAAALFDQFEDEHPVADWGGDELFNRMPRPRAVDTAPAPRFEPSRVAPEAPPRRERSLVLVDPPEDRRSAPAAEQSSARERRASQTAEEAMLERAERLGLTVVEQPRSAHRFDETGTMIEPEPAGRTTKVITGHPGGAPRPLPTVRAERRRPSRTPAEWVGPRPERIVGWAFALGLVLILIAVATAGAAAP